MIRLRHWATRYSFAVAAVLLGYLLRLALTVWVGPGLPPYITFYPAVMVVALLADFWPGVLATALAAAVVDYFIVPPVGEWLPDSPIDVVGVVLFLCMGLFMSTVARGYSRNRERTAAYERELALREKEERLRLAMEASQAAVWDWDVVANKSVCDERFSSLYGIPGGAQPLHELWLSRLHPDCRDRLVTRIRRMVETPGDDRWHEEIPLMLPDGQHRWVEEYGLVSRDEAGQAIRFSGISIDITARKQVAVALKESETRYRMLFETIDEAFVISEMIEGADGLVDFCFIEVNPAFERHSGLRSVQGQTVRQVMPGIEPRLIDRYAEIVRTGVPQRFQDYVAQLNRWFDILAWRLGGPDSKRAATLFSDITKRRQQEEKLYQSEARYRMLHESMRDAFVYVRMDGRILDFNNLYCKMLGYSPEEIQTLTYQSLTPERWHAYEDAIVRDQIIGRGYSDIYEKEYRRKDGTIFPVELRTILARDSAGTPIGMWGIVRDITRRKAAEADLRESERRERERASELAAVLDAVPAPIFIAHDVDCRHISGNRAADELLRHPSGSESSFSAPKNLRPRHFKPYKDGQELRPDELPAQRAAKGEVLRDFEFSLVFNDGEVRQVLGYGTPLLDEQGRSRGSVLVLADVTARKETEDQLRESEERLRLAWEATRDVIWDWDVEPDEQRWSATGFQVFGWTDATQNSAWWIERVHPEDRQRFVAGIRAVLDDPNRTKWEDEYRFQREDGSMAHVLDRGFVLRNSDGKPRRMIGAMQDITERKTAEQKLREAKEDLEKLVQERTAQLVTANRELEQLARQLRALAGELTTTEQRERKRLARVLHDGLQQHIVAAKLQVGGLVRPVNDPETNQIAIEVEIILDEALKVSRTLAAELSPPILHDSGLGAGLEWLSRWMSDRHGMKVEVQTEQTDAPRLADDVKAFLFEAVRELLLNVLKHAGTKSARVHLATEGGSTVRITVSDDGVGFDAASLLDTGKTTGGFGLFSIRERIALIGGGLQCDTSPGMGAKLTLTAPLEAPILPDTAPPKHGRGKTGRSHDPSPGVGKIRILLADDHAVMREGLARLLAQEPDFEVVGQSNDGQEAINQANALIPDVILMDISMPIMSGIDATRIIRQQHPGIRIIGLSLYTASERAKEMLDSGATFYLSKSDSAADLKAAIRSCMKEKAAEEMMTAAERPKT